MNNFIFHSPTEFVFGKGTENSVAQLATKYGAKNILIIYGQGSVIRSGLLSRIKDNLSKATNISYAELGGIKPNPTDKKVYEGIKICHDKNIDFILAIGGGSVIDTAKAIAAGALYDGDFWDFYIQKAAVKKAIKVGVILTIPAAGSEGSGNSVITKEETKQKLSIRVPELLRPCFSIMNPELTYTLPQYQTAAGIVDMMAHIMERYFTNTEHTEIADRLSEGVLKAIITEAPLVIENPMDYEARANIMWSGMIAHNGTCGIGCEEDWASHYMEHEVSAVYNVTHGAGLAVILPAWLTWMAHHHPIKVAQYATRVWDVPSSNKLDEVSLKGIDRLKSFFVSIGMPTTFSQLGIKDPDIKLLVEKLHQNKGEFIGAYMRLGRKETEEIYKLAL